MGFGEVFNYIRHIDPCFLLSTLMLVILLPIGFTIDHQKVIRECEESPILYLANDIILEDEVPVQFIDFLNSAQKKIEIVTSVFYPMPHFDIEKYMKLLKYTQDRGVEISIVTNNPMIASNFSFCDVTFNNFSLFVHFAQADGKRTIFASKLFGKLSSEITDFYIDFPNCASVAADTSALFNILQYYARQNAFPSLFLHKHVPGSSFDSLHSLPHNGLCSFGIAPYKLTPPGRNSITDVVNTLFNVSQTNLSIVTQNLFTDIQKVEEKMPELFLSEKIEQAAVKGASIKILIPEGQAAAHRLSYKSLEQIQGVKIRIFRNRDSYTPSFFIHDNDSGFMPMPFAEIMADNSITIAILLNEATVAEKLHSHFENLWSNQSKPLP